MNVAISVTALSVSIVTVVFVIWSWRAVNRPFVIARVVTAKSGNMATALNLLIENTGKRPARNITFTCTASKLEDAMSPMCRNAFADDVHKVFDSGTTIPILDSGTSTSCAFGMFSIQGDSTWVTDAQLPVLIKYQGLGRRRFSQEITLILRDDQSFTGESWAHNG